MKKDKKEDKKKDVEYEQYVKRIHKTGTRIMIIMLILTYIPAAVLCIFYDGFPGFGTLTATVAAMLGMEAYSWFFEPTMYFPILGVTGTYLCYASGNITNMRIPAATAAQNVADAVMGTRKSEMAGVLGIIASVVVNFIVLLLVVIFGNYLLQILPEMVEKAFGYALPAVYGTILITLVLLIKKNK